MNIIFWVFFILDGIIFLFSILLMIEMNSKNHTFSKLFQSTQKPTDKFLNETVAKQMTKLGKFLSIILVAITSIGLIAFSTAFVWIPALVWIKSGFKAAVVAFAIVFILMSSPFLVLYFNKRKLLIKGEGASIRDSIIMIFVFDLAVVIVFPELFPMTKMMEYTYLNVTMYANTITISMPILMLGTIFTNGYLFLKGIIYLGTKNSNEIKWRTKISDIATIFVISLFFGMFYVAEASLDFLPLENIVAFENVLHIFEVVLTAVLIPLVFNKAQSYVKEHTLHSEKANHETNEKDSTAIIESKKSSSTKEQ